VVLKWGRTADDRGKKMRVLSPLWRWLSRSSEVSPGTKLEDESRRKLGKMAVLLTTPWFYGASVIYFYLDRVAIWTSLLILAISFTVSLLVLPRVKDPAPLFRMNLILTGVLFAALFYGSAPYGFRALWLFAYPPACFFLLGRREGLLFSLSLLVISLGIVAAKGIGHEPFHFHEDFVLRFSLSYIVLCSLAFSYERVRVSFKDGMAQREKELIRERERLIQAKQTAEAANRAKGDFLANMSHELRTPLNHVLGFTELLADGAVGELNETQKEYLHDVLQSSRHLLSLIDDVLDFSKVEAGKLRLDLQDVHLRKVLEYTLAMVREKALRQGIQMEMQLGEAPEVIRADERKLKQIMYNLLSNAVKFTPEGGEIRVTTDVISEFGIGSLEKSPSDKSAIKISVTDTGIGIAPGDLERIFDPFEQADASVSRRYQGTGLGLSLTRSLVELHGGRIWAESEGEGKGSAFRFVIPVEERNSIIGQNEREAKREERSLQEE
jgi:signal transduction histidine kinase